MKDVARLAGVDASTVSLALRNDPRIREETRQKVKEAAQELGYSINPLIAAWVRSRRASRGTDRGVSVAYITSHPPGYKWRDSQHFLTIYQGLRDRLHAFGFSLTVFDLNEYREKPEHLDRVLFTRDVMGIVFGPENCEYRVEGLSWERYSMVAIGYALEAPRIHRVTEDHFLGMELAMARCKAMGARRIGLAFNNRYNRERRDRWLGAYLLHCHESNGALPVLDVEGDPDRISHWIEDTKPEVVLVDDPAPWSALAVPTVCFAVSEVEKANHPGVAENNIGIGRSAADALVALVLRNERGLPTMRKNIVVEPGESALGTRPLPDDLEEMFPQFDRQGS